MAAVEVVAGRECRRERGRSRGQCSTHGVGGWWRVGIAPATRARPSTLRSCIDRPCDSKRSTASNDRAIARLNRRSGQRRRARTTTSCFCSTRWTSMCRRTSGERARDFRQRLGQAHSPGGTWTSRHLDARSIPFAYPICSLGQVVGRTLPLCTKPEKHSVMSASDAGRMFQGLQPRLSSEAARRSGALNPAAPPPGPVATVGENRSQERALRGNEGKARARLLMTSLAPPRRSRGAPAVGAPPGHAPERVGSIAQPQRHG